jgi:hypothetical protein
MPKNQNAGDSAPTALPPSSGSTGARLNRLRKKPVYASPRNSGLSVAA